MPAKLRIRAVAQAEMHVNADGDMFKFPSTTCDLRRNLLRTLASFDSEGQWMPRLSHGPHGYHGEMPRSSRRNDCYPYTVKLWRAGEDPF